MNYNINIDKENIVISEEEYGIIKEGIKNKSNLIFLRNGNLCINPIMIKFVKETHAPTDEQVQKRDSQLKLSPGERGTDREVERKKLRTSATGFSRMLEDDGWKNCSQCGEVHFLDERETCLGCVKNTIKV